jgi:hypothetical protein
MQLPEYSPDNPRFHIILFVLLALALAAVLWYAWPHG